MPVVFEGDCWDLKVAIVIGEGVADHTRRSFRSLVALRWTRRFLVSFLGQDLLDPLSLCDSGVVLLSRTFAPRLFLESHIEDPDVPR